MTKHSVQNSLLVLNSVIDRYDTKNRPVSNNGSAMQLRAKLDVSLGDDGADMSELEEMALNYLNINPDVSSAKFNKLL